LMTASPPRMTAATTTMGTQARLRTLNIGLSLRSLLRHHPAGALES
jgi:hypothetical protein